jgi:hypothetical protein
MAFLHDDVLDDGLQVLTDATSKELHICSQIPTTRTEAVTTFTLGNKSAPTVGAPTDGDANGRKAVVSAITDGNVTATDTATHWALVDGTRLLAAQTLASSQAVTSGNVFTLAAIDITIPDPA